MVDGRRGDVIITGGEKVWPARIEALLSQDPSIAEVALVGRPHPDWGHTVVAVVVPTDPAGPPALEHIREIVGESFPHWCAPRELVIRKSLPKTSLGKIRREELAH